MINSILLRPLPFPDSDRLVTIFNTYPKAGVENDGSSVTNYYERRGNIPAFSSLSIYRDSTEIVGEAGSTQQEEILRISPEFFTTLGVSPAMGRSFNEEEARRSNDSVVILTDAYWRQQFQFRSKRARSGDPREWMPRKIVGVLPPDFRFLSSKARVFLPLKSGVGAARSEAAPFRRRRHAHDRAVETRRDDRRSAIPDRRAQCRGREG